MKKLTLLVAALTAGLFAVSAAHAQTTDTTTTTTRKSHRKTISSSNNSSLNARLRRIESRSHEITTTTPQGTRIDGSVTRAARSGNALQMVNPFAPAAYGDGRDVTRHEPDDAFQRPEGLRLFAVEF